MAKWASDKKRPVDSIFPERREAMQDRKCIPAPIGCGKVASHFKDDISAKEYRISGLCQNCQDSIFGS